MSRPPVASASRKVGGRNDGHDGVGIILRKETGTNVRVVKPDEFAENINQGRETQVGNRTGAKGWGKMGGVWGGERGLSRRMVGKPH